MNQKSLSIDQEILIKYPDISIGYLVVDNLHLIADSKITEEIKNLPLNNITDNNLTIQNLVEFPTIAKWRQIYNDCGVKPKTFKSSIESLLRRFIQNDYKTIIPIVDIYNYISAGYFLSVGGYDLEKIDGVLSLRFSKIGDKFISLNGKEDIIISPKHIIYADENINESVICWMWNHKDCKRTMLSNEVKKGLFIFDCLCQMDKERLIKAQKELSKILTQFGGEVISIGILNMENPIVNF